MSSILLKQLNTLPVYYCSYELFVAMTSPSFQVKGRPAAAAQLEASNKHRNETGRLPTVEQASEQVVLFGRREGRLFGSLLLAPGDPFWAPSSLGEINSRDRRKDEPNENIRP